MLTNKSTLYLKIFILLSKEEHPPKTVNITANI